MNNVDLHREDHNQFRTPNEPYGTGRLSHLNEDGNITNEKVSQLGDSEGFSVSRTISASEHVVHEVCTHGQICSILAVFHQQSE